MVGEVGEDVEVGEQGDDGRGEEHDDGGGEGTELAGLSDGRRFLVIAVELHGGGWAAGKPARSRAMTVRTQ